MEDKLRSYIESIADKVVLEDIRRAYTSGKNINPVEIADRYKLPIVRAVVIAFDLASRKD